MSFLRYAKNIGRSTAYALPAIVKNRIPSVAALVGQFSDSGQREINGGSLQEIRGILKEDVFGLLRTGLNNASSELKSGKLYRTEEEQASDMNAAMGLDDFSLDNSFLDGADFEDDGEGGGSPDRATAGIAAAAAAAGAASGVQAAAARLGDSPAARATAEAGMATARFSRATLGANIAVGNAIRSAVLANAHALTEIHAFQTGARQDFYRKQIEHNMAMAAMTSEMLSRIAELKDVSTVAAAASDQIMQVFSGRQTDFSRVFTVDGGMDVGSYLGVMTQRLKQAVGDGSMFKMIGSSFAAGPVTKSFQMALESLIPKDFGKQLEQFNDFFGKLGTMLNERMQHAARGLAAKGRAGGIASKLLNFFSISPDTAAAGPDLSRIIRGKAVAFDGYAHRSLVEVIPSHLADIHAELVAMRRARGIADPADRKLYDFNTGRFASEKLTRAQFEAGVERASMQHFDRVRAVIGDDGDVNKAKEIERALAVLRNERMSINKGSVEDFGSQLDEMIASIRNSGRINDADALAESRDQLVKSRENHGARFAFELQTAISRADAAKSKSYEAIETAEGVHRGMYSGAIYDADARRTVAGDLAIDGVPGASSAQQSSVDAAISGLNSTSVVGAERGFEKGASGNIFRDERGRVTLKSILQSPMVAVSKAMDSFETKVSDIFFGDGKGKGGVFGSIKSALLGDIDPATGRHTGPLGKVVDYVKFNVFNPLKKAMVGDPSDPASVEKSIVGTTKRWFKEAVDGGARFLFGNKVEGEDGSITRQGGLFGGVVNWFSGKSKQLKEYLLGKGGDGKQPGLLTGLREKFDKMVDRVQKSLFGTVGEDGRRAGGAFGDGIQKGKDFLKSLWDKFQETAVKPLGTMLFGAVGANGRRAGGMFGDGIQKGKDFLSKLWSDTQEFVLAPMKKALFGKGVAVDDGFGNVTYKDRGIFPVLGDTIKSSIIEPMAKGLFGEKQFKGLDANGNPIMKREGGAVGQIWTAVKDAFAPLKETFVGPDGIWTNMKKGLSDTFRDLKRSLFGGKEGEEDKPFMQRIGEKISDGIRKVGDWLQETLKPVTGWIQKSGEWLRTKVFEPFNVWMNDPQTGFVTRMRNGVATFFYGEKGDDGVRKGGLFGSVKDTINRFFYGDPEKGTKGFVERVVEPAKKFVLEEIWNPLKKSVNEMWEGTKTFFKEEIFKPLHGVIQPFVTEAKEQWRLMKEWVKGPLWDSIKGVGAQLNDFMKDVFGKSFTDMMRDNVLNPIKEALSGVRKFLGNTLKAVLKFPVNVLKGASDELAMSQIKRGIFKGSEAERERLMGKFGAKEGSVPAGQGSSIGAVKPEIKPGGAVGKSDVAADREEKKKGFFSRFFGKKDESQNKSDGTKAGESAVKTATTSAANVGGVETRAPVAGASDAVKSSGGAQSVSQPTPDVKAKDAVAAKSDAVKSSGGAQSVSQPTPDVKAKDAAAAKADAVKSSVGAQSVSQAAPGPTRAEQAAAESSKDGSSVKGGAAAKYDPIRLAQATADNTHNIYQFMTKHLWGVGKNVERIVKHFKIKDTALGGNTDEKAPSGIFGKLRRMVTNPIGFFKNIVTGTFDYVKGIGKRLFEAAKNVVMVPAKLLGKGLSMATKAITGVIKAVAPLAGVLKDALVGTLTAAVKVTATVIKESAKAVGTVVSSIAKAIPDVASALANATVGILKAGAQLALGAAKIAGQLAATLVEIGGKMIATAAKVAKDVVTGLARVTFDAIGSAFNMMTGRSTQAKLGKLTPVYVIGGYLAGTEGGVGSWTAAQAAAGGGRIVRAAAGAAVGSVTGIGAILGAGMGFFSPEMAERLAEGKLSITTALKRSKERMLAPFVAAGNAMKGAKKKLGAAADRIFGRSAVTDDHGNSVEVGDRIGGLFSGMKDKAAGGFEAVREKTAKATAAVKEMKWKSSLLSASEKTKEHLGGIRSGFSRFGSWLMALFPALVSGIGALVTFFTKGKFISALGGLLRGGAGLVQGTGKAIGKAAGGVGNALKGGAWKGVGLGAIAGIGGTLVKDAADGMEDGAAKTAVKTGGAMLEYGGMGAMIGSVIPGVGTAVGAGVGAAVGAAVENWDSIVKTAGKMWEMTKKAGRTIGEAASWLADGVKTASKAVWSHFFGNDVEIDEKTGKVIRQEKSNLLGRMWEGLVGSDEKKLADGQIVKEGGLGLLGNVNNVLMNTVGVFGKMLSGDEWSAGDFVKGTVLEGITTKISDALESFWQGLLGIKDGLVAGFKYVTEFKFVDDIKSAISNWWNGEDETQKNQEGGSEFVGPSDQRTWYQKLGNSLTSWADSNKSKVNSITVDKQGNEIANRAYGGPLGKGGTMVGELGPELLDANGNVISGARRGSSMFSDPKLARAGKEREDSISGMLANSEKNSFYTAQLLQSINTAVGGAPVDPLRASNDAVFDPRTGVSVGEKRGLFSTMAAAFGIDPETGEKVAEVGSAIGGTMAEVGEHALSGIKGMASSIWSGAKGAATAVVKGDFKGAADAIKSGAGGVADSVRAATSGIGGALSSGASAVGSVIRGDGAKNLEFLKGFMQQNGMTDPKEQAMFLSQLDHESGGFKVLSENLRYTPENLIKVFPKYFKSIDESRQVAAGGPEAIANRVYGNRMGNKQEGDGFKYRGRGFIQLTGRDNYVRAGKDLGMDLENNPDLAAQPENAAKIALWYWKQRGLSGPAQAGDIEKVTRLINGGTNGLDDRKSKFAKYLSVTGNQTALAQGGPTPIKTAMTGGWIDKQFPTLVGEREPEVLGPDGRIHRSVDSFLNSPSADVSGLAVSTAIKEAARRAGSGPDHQGAGEAMSKIVAAAGSMGGKSEELLAQMLQALQQIVGNTAKIGDLAAAAPAENKSVSVDASTKNGGNIFTLGQSQSTATPGMSQIMRKVMAGGS